MKVALTKKAHEYFRNGRFSDALALYQELGRRLDTSAFGLNIIICEKRLSELRENKAHAVGSTESRQRHFDVLGLRAEPERINSKGVLPELRNRSRREYTKVDLKRAEKYVDNLRRKMLSLGFYEEALPELQARADVGNPARRLVASRELILFYINQGTPEAAKKVDRYIDYCLKNEQDESYYRKAAVMKAESLRLQNQRHLERSFYQLVRMEVGDFPDLLLAYANTFENAHERIEQVNKLYRETGLATITLTASLNGDGEDYNRLTVETALPVCEASQKPDAPLVTVIVPTYNAEDTLPVALRSLLVQSWQHLEILVVDDCSTDSTADVVRAFARQDGRVRLISAERNGGPYIARNLALLEAKGDLITINDADDWSHPQKLEIQVSHLQNNPEVVGNTSQQARATPDLHFHRRSNYGYFIFMNMSSFLFRRQVLKDVGFWDSVRFGADSEFIRRIRKVYGEKSMANLPTVPLSFQRQSAGSLTGNSAFGYHGFFMGARREHFESYLHFHKESDTAYYPFPQTRRPFPVPEPMRPERAPKNSAGQREFDVVIVSDFRLDGGSTLSSVEEIKAHRAAGLTTALVQMCRYDYPARKKVNPCVRELLEEGVVEFVVYGERIKCKHAIFRYPPILQHRQAYVPELEADEVSVIVNQPPMSDYGPEAELRYELPRADAYVQKLLGKKPVWRPIGPAVREALHQHHSEDLPAINLAGEDWCNVIDVDHWYRGDYTPNVEQPVIARHSRDNHHKWPEKQEDLLAAYPDSRRFKVKVLGGAKTAKEILGRIPSNWEVYDFGALHPKDFLQNVDVYVYYTHPDWVESFGRVVLEAMAVGIPVVVPEVYKPLFGNAAIYADITDVEAVVKNLVEDPVHYREMAERALELVREKFSYSAHVGRLSSVKFRA